jgi:hypothetical protein
MNGQVGRSSLRSRLYSLARDFVARGLLREGNSIWSDEPHKIDRAIEKVEQAWSLTGDPEIAVQLSTMYDQANQNDEALVVLREAFRRNPRHALVRHHAAITLLRHGTAADVRDFFDSVLKVDPDDAFAQFVVSLLDSYDGWVDELISSIPGQPDGRQPFVISCPVWGQPFADDFVRYSCAALLSPNNLPKLAERRSVHIVIFTTIATENHLCADPLFARLSEYATVRFVRYSDSQVNYRQAMEAHYAREDVPYSDHSLAFYYERNCKFLLMSCAHYVALAAGRARDALVSCQVADTLLNDGALTVMADRIAGGADAVLVNCIQMEGTVLRPLLDDAFRHDDGVIQISSESCAKILAEHMPAYNFAGAGNLPQIPLRVCWRVGAQGILVHGNHYHPFCLRPKAFAHPLQLTIDPIDSRFIDRSSLELDRIHLVQDESVVGLSMEDGPPPEQFAHRAEPLALADAAFWLWGYWGRLRGAFYRTPLRLGRKTPCEQWAQAEVEASAVVDAIVEQAAKFEERRRATGSWRL